MIDTEVVQSLVTALSTGLAGWFYRLLQKEIRKRPSPESYAKEVTRVLNGTPEELRLLRHSNIRNVAKIKVIEGTLIRLEVAQETLAGRVERLES